MLCHKSCDTHTTLGIVSFAEAAADDSGCSLFATLAYMRMHNRSRRCRCALKFGHLSDVCVCVSVFVYDCSMEKTDTESTTPGSGYLFVIQQHSTYTHTYTPQPYVRRNETFAYDFNSLQRRARDRIVRYGSRPAARQKAAIPLPIE